MDAFFITSISSKTFCAISHDLKAVANRVIEIIKIIATALFAFFAGFFRNIQSVVFHKAIYPQRAPIIPDGKNWVQATEGEGDPIIFVHGRNGHHSNFTALMARMQKEGCNRPFYVVQVNGNSEISIEESALKINQAALEILKTRQAKPTEGMVKKNFNWLNPPKQETVSLIGHSYGGLHIAEVACQAKFSIDQITTIASPMQGTKAANLPGLKPVVVDNLAYGAPKIDTLNRRLAKTNVKIVNIVSNLDFIVFPPAAQVARAPRIELYYKGKEGHMGILDDPWTARQVAAFH